MKKLFIILALGLFSCQAEKQEEVKPELNCYNILARGTDSRGDYIIINYSDYNQKRYKVDNYLEYLNKSTICEPINLTQQPL